MLSSTTKALGVRQLWRAAASRTATARVPRLTLTAAATARQPAAAPSSARHVSTSAVRRQEEEEVRSEPTSGEQDIIDILTRQFKPKMLQVQDVSGGCGSFYSIQIASSKFKGVSTIKAHRQVNDVLKQIIKDIHGLQLRTMSADD